ncbi:transcription elongation factor GreA [Bradyrhizobium erythrophlei]|jgi:transcription elongation GreA/GreB family factor|uniref:Transcription elongation factor, GreA/GreB family n=1 Tax=Bradyrhizobium erythrophlei TaxID=1437360 RepID=A0A1M5VV00_9BRAD|nr:transcription elongation factor GreA [Bradyrhizobium erythrophlei]SHH78753.1 Transcription elongation factor, GreA/GreB family [Bradyrhizobium erythrophlei]
MSRAFVRDQDDSIEDVSDRPVSEHPNDVTETGMAEIEAALAGARAAHATALASSDRRAIAAAARDLRYWSARRATARLVPAPTDRSRVRFGTTVSIIRNDGREQTFRIVGEDEADPAKGSISHVSPLARAMLGKGIGEVVRAGNDDAEIISIK